MKRTWIIVAAIALLVVVGWFLYNANATQRAAEEASSEAERAALSDDLDNVIWASGKLEPITWAALGPVNSGIVSVIHVAEGDWVEAGQLLLALNSDVLESQVGVAAAAVAEAEAALSKLLAGATKSEIAAAKAQVAVADANVALAAGQMLEAQAAIDSATAFVETARREYAELASHPTAAESTVAKADVAIAQAGVSQAQAAYNLVRGDPQIAARPEALALYQATAGLEAAQARAALTELGPTPEQLAVAQGAIQTAEAEISAAKSRGPGAEANAQAALANLASAQAELERLLAGATPEDIAIAEARVQSAQAALNSAAARLVENQVVAPFAGQVGRIDTRLGELTQIGQTLVLLGDANQMHIVTTDLRETDVVRLNPGMSVEVTFDALPDQIFTGNVTHVAPVSSTDKGSTNYTIHVTVDDLDPELRWGMTAFVNIAAPR